MTSQVYVASPRYLLESFNSLDNAWPVLDFDLPWLLTPNLVRLHHQSGNVNTEVYNILDKISKNVQYRLRHQEYPDHEWMYGVGVLFSLADASRLPCSNAVPSRHMINVLVSRILLTRSASPQTVEELHGFWDLFMRRFNEAGWLDVNRKHLVPKGRNLQLDGKAKICQTSGDLHNMKKCLKKVLGMWTSTPFRGYTPHDNEGRPLAFFLLGVFGFLLLELRADITSILWETSRQVAEEFENACMRLLGVRSFV